MLRSNSKLFFLIFIFVFCLNINAKEKIINYDVIFDFTDDLNIQVTENITVNAEGRNIKRGIYREFPTKYKTFVEGNINVTFNIVSIKRDGLKEDWHIEKKINGVRIYIGNKNRRVPVGTHTYQIKYNTSRQVFFGKDYDQIYWNITGQGWLFQIDKAKCEFILPERLKEEILDITAFTGKQGEEGTDYSLNYNDYGNPVINTSKTLYSNSGISARLRFNKGIIQKPTFNQKVKFFFYDNKDFLFGLVGIIVVLLYYLIVWSIYGVDPPKGTIIPRFKTPNKMSGAECGYLLNMGWDDKLFSSQIIGLAISGHIKIYETTADTFMLEKLNKPDDNLTKQDKTLMKNLFFKGDQLFIDSSEHSVISEAKNKLSSYLEKKYNTVLFHNNYNFTAVGIFLSFFFLAFSLSADNTLNFMDILKSLIYFFGVTALMFLLLSSSIKEYKKIKKYGQSNSEDFKDRLPSIFIILRNIIIVLLLGLIGYLLFVEHLLLTVSLPLILLIITSILLNVIFTHLMKAPSKYGRTLMDKIEGLKMYLSVAEKEWLKKFTPPERTPEEFEKFLPYAIALDVENEWGEKFTSHFHTGVVSGDINYSPSWYTSSRHTRFSTRNFSCNISSSFSTAISSAAVPPSKGGGSGFGGGFGGAGGGGGGGGGGGW